MGRLNNRLSILIAGGLLLAGSLSAIAGRHDEARDAMRRGEILPLEQIIQRLRQHDAGEVLEVELERKRGRQVYELEVLGADGVVNEYYFDAASGELLKRKRED